MGTRNGYVGVMNAMVEMLLLPGAVLGALGALLALIAWLLP